MPKPGPRPYECVRRAWHSDRHHPVRGSVIQEIFRIVNDVHCMATRKNREWQEKLPIVVLKAEEIMYSRANSELEYSDLKTLWRRVEDAINTIIRKDEDTETGELLQPCIEAALLLGCTPRRSSRSQRNDSPKYLRPEFSSATSVNPLMLQYAQFMNPTSTCLKFEHQDIEDVNEKLPNRYDPCQTIASSNTVCTYPLFNNDQIQHSFHSNEASNLQNLFADRLHDKMDASSNDKECDLTLRLGSLEVPCERIETS